MTDRKNSLTRAIASVFHKLGEASPKQVQIALSYSDDDAPLLRQAIARMLDSSILKKVEYGRYTLCAGWEKRIKTHHEKVEDDLVQELVERGGFARTGDLIDAIFGPQQIGEERPFERRIVTTCLKASPKFCQDLGRGWWNLNEDELGRVPLAGKWTAKLLERGIGLTHPDGDWAAERDEMYERIGTAFFEARGNRSLEAVLGVQAVADMIDAMARLACSAQRAAFQAVRKSSPNLNSEEAQQAARCELLAMFEFGNGSLHLSAPVGLYKVCAEVYGVCPAALSRGFVQPLPLLEKGDDT